MVTLPVSVKHIHVSYKTEFIHVMTNQGLYMCFWTKHLQWQQTEQTSCSHTVCHFSLKLAHNCSLSSGLIHSFCLPSPGTDILSQPPPPPLTTPVTLTAAGKTINTPSLQRTAVRGRQLAALLTDCLPVARCPALGQRLCYYDWLGHSDKQPASKPVSQPSSLSAFLQAHYPSAGLAAAASRHVCGG